MRSELTAAVALCACLSSSSAWATGFDGDSEDLRERDNFTVELDGYLRVRGAMLNNFDLDRGTTPSGAPLFPVPLGDPKSQFLSYADTRMRTDIALYPPGYGVALKVRLDALDNLALGSSPAVTGGNVLATTEGQTSPPNVLRLKQAYGEALTPFGVLSAGRMPVQWGLGIVAHNGDCLDCDGGTTADRIQFVTHIAGHSWTIAYDISSSGPQTQNSSAQHVIDVEPSDDVRTFTATILRQRTEATRVRRARAGKATFEYGAFYTHRSQSDDVPAGYAVSTPPLALSHASVVRRGFVANTFDVWLGLRLPWLRLETEAALIVAEVEQAAALPGVELNDAIESTQFGIAFESEAGPLEGNYGLGIDAGYASGDPAPGFGAFPANGPDTPQAGELDGPQATLTGDNRVDNFRFHSDYRIDRILFREIIGTVTDTVYVRPHGQVRLFRVGPSSLSLSLAAVATFATFRASTPGNAGPLGMELDPSLTYRNTSGFVSSLDYAVLFPLAGLHNPSQDLNARAAQMARLRIAYLF